jgi:tape measure domain-containing protein
LATLRIETEVDRSGEIKVRKLREEVGKLSKAETSNMAASKKMSAGIGVLATRAAGVAATFYTAKISLDAYTKSVDLMTNAENRIRLATTSTQELASAQRELFESSQDNRVAYAASAELFQRISLGTRDLNLEMQRRLDLTNMINQAVIVSGTSAVAAQGAIVQLGQAFSADFKAVGQELMSIREQTPRLYRAILDGLEETSDIAAKDFRKAAEDGRISSEMVIKALETQGSSLAKEFGKIDKTFGQVGQSLSNSTAKFIGDLDDALGASEAITQSLYDIARAVDEVDFSDPETLATVDFMRATVSRTIDLFNLLYETVENTGQNVVSGIAAYTYGTLAPILEMMRVVTEGLNSIGLSSDETLERVLRSEIAIKDAAAQAAKDIAGNNDEMLEALKKFSPTIEERIEGYRKERVAIKDVTEEVKKQKKVMKGFIADVDEVAKAEDALWKHSQKMQSDWLRDTLAASDKALDQWQEYYESTHDMANAWAIEETRIRKEWADFPELENFIKIRKKLFEEQHAQPGESPLQAEIDSLKNHYDQIAHMESDTAQHRIDIVRQAMAEKLIAIQEGNALIEQIEAEHQNNLTDLTRWGLTSRKEFDQMSYGDRGMMFAAFAETLTSEASQYNETAFRINQAAAIANATISTAQGVAKALEFGPIMGPIFAGMIAAQGGAQIATIASQQYQGYETGGVVPGGEQLIRINERGQEAVLNAQATRAIGKEGVDALNSGKGLSQAPVVNLKTVNVLDPAMVGDYLDSSDSDTVFINKISRNAEQIRSALNA